MKAILTLSRLCLRQSLPRIKPPAVQARTYRTVANRFAGARSQFYRPPNNARKLLWAVAALSPAVFVQLSEKDNNGTDHTAEARMLAASREEIEKRLSDDDHGLSRVYHSIVLFLDIYIWEPVCTGIRLVYLGLIFIPVLATVPAIWIGRRQPKRDNERSGTLWWYRFLVRAMERAGPAFIKAGFLSPFSQAILTSPS